MSITERDAGGKIRGKKLTSEEASKLAKSRWNKQKVEIVEELLDEFGYESIDDAPMHLKLLAEKSAVSGSGSVGALNTFIKALRDNRAGESVERPLQPGELCPRCGSNVLFSKDVLQRILDDTGGDVFEAEPASVN